MVFRMQQHRCAREWTVSTDHDSLFFIIKTHTSLQSVDHVCRFEHVPMDHIRWTYCFDSLEDHSLSALCIKQEALSTPWQTRQPMKMETTSGIVGILGLLVHINHKWTNLHGSNLLTTFAQIVRLQHGLCRDRWGCFNGLGHGREGLAPDLSS